MLTGVFQAVRREIFDHSSQRPRDVNDRYTQIELPEKLEAILKLETWLERQTQLLPKEEAKSLPPQSSTEVTTKEHPNGGNQHAVA